MLIPLSLSIFLPYVPPGLLGVPRRCRKVGVRIVKIKGPDLMGDEDVG